MMIRVLEKDVADKIAAGEVIERPVSIIKELVENSIDAEATAITVEIKNGGKSYIRVTDNGCGIKSSEVKTAFLRHATSKINRAEDLDSIETLGFRGEALASISAVTRLELITKTAEESAGYRIVIHGGDVVDEGVTGCPEGTTFIVRDLFYNMPAREKFLKSDSAESVQIIELMEKLALTKVNIRFRLINNGNTVFSTSGKGDLLKTILAVYKENDYRDLVKIDYRSDEMHIYGYISKPSLSRSNRRSQFFFVNGRTIKSKVLERGLTAGYRERLFEGRYPIVFLFTDIRPDMLDVNIHPNKKEVRFDDEKLVSAKVSEAIIEALASKEAVVDVKEENHFAHLKRIGELVESPKKPFSREISEGSEDVKMQTQLNIKEFLKGKRKEEDNFVTEISEQRTRASVVAEERQGYDNEKWEKFVKPDEQKPEVLVSEAPEAEAEFLISADDFDLSPSHIPFDFDSLSVGGAIFGTYITATDDKNFYLIDQHAAHERIFYEKLVGEYLESEKHSQLLLTNFTVDVPSSIAQDDKRWLEIVRGLGYTVELFGENTYVVRGIPQFMEISEAEEFLKSCIDSFDGENVLNRVVIDKLITKSCKSAIKARDYIKQSEVDALINQLKECKNPFSCPHGRPTFIKMSVYEIERMFKRA